MEWQQDSVLSNMSSYTSTKDIFDAVCKEIAKYYADFEAFKCLKRKVRWIGTNVICEFAFWSSHSNMSGEYVCFEIVSSVYSKDHENMEKKGLLYTYIRPVNYNVYEISRERFLEIIAFIDKTVEYVRTLETLEGFQKFMIENQDVDRISKETNNIMFLEKLRKKYEVAE